MPEIPSAGAQRVEPDPDGTGVVLSVDIHDNLPASTEDLENDDYLGSSTMIDADDPMVKKLLRNKEDKYADYELDVFERSLSASFEILRREPLNDGLRVIYFARPRGGPVPDSAG